MAIRVSILCLRALLGYQFKKEGVRHSSNHVHVLNGVDYLDISIYAYMPIEHAYACVPLVYNSRGDRGWRARIWEGIVSSPQGDC